MQTIEEKIEAATASIKKAKVKTFHLIKDGGYTHTLTAAAFKKLKPAPVELADVIDSVYDAITPALIDKLKAALKKPSAFFEDEDGNEFTRKQVENAKTVQGITFEYAGRTAYLLDTGRLKIGCQNHPLSTWANTRGEHFGSGLAAYLAGDNGPARDALIPVLKARLKAMRTAAKQ